MDKIKGILVRFKKLSRRKKLILSIIFLLFVILIVAFILSKKVLNTEKNEINYNEVVTHSTDRPSERKPKDFEVPPDIPKRINLKSIRKEGYIQMVGIDQYGNIAVPSNVHMAGWYINSVRPGEEGLSIITGHRDGIMKKGIFRYLGNLKKDDEIEVEYGDGSLRYFKVVEVKEITTEDAYDAMYEKRENIKKQLNLITCTGTYNKENQTYDKRTVVITKGI